MTKTALPYIREIDRNRHRLYDTGIRKNPWGMRKLPALTEAEKGRRNGMTKKKSEEMTREQKADVREKRAATYEEQIAMIRNKGFIIYEDEEKDCIAFLKKVNYYRFSAYFLPYLKEDRSFQRGVSFFRIQRTYEFDSRIRALIFEIIEDVEVSLRTKLSYYISQKYGPYGHLGDGMYTKKHNERSFQGRVKSCVEQNRDSPAIQESLRKNGGRIPLWIIVEFFSMGMLAYLYSDMKPQDQKKIAEEICGTGVRQMDSWLRCVTELRNRCAHYLRLYCWSFSSVPKMPEGFDFSADRSLFSQLLVLKFLYPDAREWNFKMMAVLEPLMEEYENDIELRHIGFPENWKELL